MKLWPMGRSPESHNPVELVTVCVTGSVLVHRMVAPTGTVMVDGLKVKPMIVTGNVFIGFVTINSIESDWLIVPEVAVTINAKVPKGGLNSCADSALCKICSPSVALACPFAGGVTVVGFSVAPIDTVGVITAAKVTGELKPPTEVTVTVNVTP